MKNISYLSFVLFLVIVSSSCNKKEILKERPKDFLTPSNSFNKPDQFVSSLAGIYRVIRSDFYNNADSYMNFDMQGLGTDLAGYQSSGGIFIPYFYWNTLNADDGFSAKWWRRFYDIISRADVIIDQAENKDIKWPSEEEKNAIIGEARFLRAWGYHFLANMWGGVPLVPHKPTTPKFDYRRASQDSIYQQCKEDLEFAIKWMKTVDQLKGGRAPRAAAYTLLSEVDISLKDYQGAIDAASVVINDPNFHLMTQRFGVYKDFKFNGYNYQGPGEPWGDVYWDLFREGNFDWLAGNYEAIWNTEFNYSVRGGDGMVGTQYGGSFGLERWWGGYDVWRAKDKNGVVNWMKDTLGGRPVEKGITGTEFIDSLIWAYKGDWDRDIRNSKYNIQRTFYWNNPSSAFYGQPITINNIGDPSIFYHDTKPSFKKAVTAVHHGESTTSEGQRHDNGRIFKDWYIMRLPDDYFLRSEAYYHMGNLQKAADDLNVIRNRANATPVSSGDMSLDLILDERARELYMEEFRINTLMRMGKLAERVMKYNPLAIQNGWQLDDHLNKLPIPTYEIEANTGYKLEQNPGY